MPRCGRLPGSSVRSSPDLTASRARAVSQQREAALRRLRPHPHLNSESSQPPGRRTGHAPVAQQVSSTRLLIEGSRVRVPPGVPARTPRARRRWPVAQPAEQLPVKETVAGSIPAWPAAAPTGGGHFGGGCRLLEVGADCKSVAPQCTWGFDSPSADSCPLRSPRRGAAPRAWPEQADAPVSNTGGRTLPCGFDSRRPHQQPPPGKAAPDTSRGEQPAPPMTRPHRVPPMPGPPVRADTTHSPSCPARPGWSRREGM